MSGFSLRQAAGAAAPATDPKPGQSPGVWLQEHRFTVIAGGGIAVVLLALYKRSQANTVTGDPSTSTGTLDPSLAGSYADTTSADIYNALEPLIEGMSGFDGTQQILQQNQNILDAIGKLNGGGTTTTPTPTPATSNPGYYQLTANDLPAKNGGFDALAKKLNVSPTMLYLDNPTIQFGQKGVGWQIGNFLKLPTATYAQDAQVKKDLAGMKK